VASFPFAIFVGFSSILFMTASTAIVQVRAEPEMRGRVLALQAIVFLGSTPIGGPLIGWVCDAFGARAGIVVGGLAALGAAAWGYVADGRRVRDVAPTEPMTKAAVDAPITRETPLVH
jgi:MFS family permease